jgi:hypothetical protein
MKHQYEDYIEFVEEMIADTGDDRSFYFNTAFRASLLANKATLERHRPKEHCKNPNCAGPICLGCGSKETVQIAFPCPSFLDVTNQLDKVME